MKRMKVWGALLVLCLSTACATVTPQLKAPPIRPGWPGEDGSNEQVAAQQYGEALHLLETSANSESVNQAGELLRKSCEGGHLAACQHLNEHLQPPIRIPGPDFSYTKYAATHGIEGMMSVRCQISTEGQVGLCRVLEDIPGLTDELLQKVEQQKFKPARFHGTPVKVDYTFNIHLSIPRLSPIQRLYVARKRTQEFPNSPGTWKHLARTLYELEPGSTEIPFAIERAFELRPKDDWLLHLMAQLRAHQGDMEAARTYALEAVRASPYNSAYLNTYATTEAALGRCAEALRAQRRAVEELPGTAPPAFAAALRERLADYEARCGTQG